MSIPKITLEDTNPHGYTSLPYNQTSKLSTRHLAIPKKNKFGNPQIVGREAFILNYLDEMAAVKPHMSAAMDFFATDDDIEPEEIAFITDLATRDIFVMQYMHGAEFEAEPGMIMPGYFTRGDMAQNPIIRLLVHKKYNASVLCDRLKKHVVDLVYVVRSMEGHVIGGNVDDETKIVFMDKLVNIQGKPAPYHMTPEERNLPFELFDDMPTHVQRYMLNLDVLTVSLTSPDDDVFDLLRLLFSFESPFFRG